MQHFFEQFLQNLRDTSFLEFIAVVSGIGSVWFSKKENILVYPVGLVNTIIYIYLSFDRHLFGEASVNFYYTVMSIYGWWLWTRKDRQQHHIVQIRYSTGKEWAYQLLFFAAFYVAIYFALVYLRQKFDASTIPWADAFASATAYTGMWLMARKKVESWVWWVLTNIASIPLYFVKGLAFTSVYYVVLLILAFSGLAEWRKKAAANNQSAISTR
jgi:nicotinamide mononucleotide transporter